MLLHNPLFRVGEHLRYIQAEDRGNLDLYLYLRYKFQPFLLLVSESKVSKDTIDTALMYLYLYLRYIFKVSSPTLKIVLFRSLNHLAFNTLHFLFLYQKNIHKVKHRIANIRAQKPWVRVRLTNCSQKVYPTFLRGYSSPWTMLPSRNAWR